MYLQRLQQELKELSKNPVDNCSAGPIDDDITLWYGTIIGPTETPYEGGVFNLNIEFTREYPFVAPKIYFTTPIYHCNINRRGGICLDILNKNWSPALTISKVLMSICSLLAEPNPDDPLVPEIAELLRSNKVLHDANARDYTLQHANT
uniref:E2 ubiquitin-conjugating enzyme n=1 Tax=Megaviridae environmental sample TaxID=1737588 RepID=A0A5J6VLI0_9VIRU|nr:MAG: ubiquitin-conjugating enzyme [Megaviridae environmental sample]